jgi:hypothetical protein
MRTEGLSEFESAVLNWIASSMDDPALRTQLAAATVRERDYTVVGCYSQLALPVGAPRTPHDYGSHGPLNGPSFESPVVPYGGGTLLWFKDGLADCLEIFTYGGYFPVDHEDLSSFKLDVSA